MPDEPTEELTGIVERITFRNDENGYTVARFQTDELGLITITGRFASINESEPILLVGRWDEHPKFGRQFIVSTYRPNLPATLKGMEKYLASGLIKGIGPAYAKRIVAHFGKEVFDVIENHPERLKEVEGIGRKRAVDLMDSFRRQAAVRSLMVFLQEFDVSSNLAIRIYKEYGDDSLRVLKENPYALADDIFGVGFKTADSVARKIGMSETDPRRYRAGLQYVLQAARDDGHVYLPRIELISVASELMDADCNAVEEQLECLVANKTVVNDHDRIYLEFLFKAEGEIAKKLADLSEGKVKDYNREKFAAMIDEIQRVEKLSLAPEQLRAVTAAYENQCMVLTGRPGTGKSTTVKVIVRMFERLGKTTRLASPTGRAAKRLEEAAGRPASTIHRLLEFKPQLGFVRNADVPLDCKVLIIDETSMVDIPLGFALLRALPRKCRLILVGDVDQLPSVGPGCFLRDIIDSGIIRTVELTEIFRQAKGSLIVTNAHRINGGQPPIFDPESGRKDFEWIKEEDREEVGNRVIQQIRDRLSSEFDPMTEIQVLSPMHAGLAGARELNRRLQETCNAPCEGKVELRLGERTFREGDRVMQVRNNYELEVFNGDIGRIASIDPSAKTMVIQYDKLVHYRRSDIDELQLAYSITVHKSQGSEYPCVVIPLTTAHWMMLQRNLLYTAVTRAKKLCVLVGMRKGLIHAIYNAHIAERYTNLRCRLMEARNQHEPQGSESESSE